ncbi:hypothetical protein MC5_04175 [Rickettsia australis str. Cutlack]|uniref:Uncharacterized protein n=1 Tax=Rickettsia australis (strain Cutlack) TaxID=1105110 RepID=H8K7A6_RICAC|nr:hypothetical protein MC5_04175 [Rickettsia australis str. Cutlack]
MLSVLFAFFAQAFGAWLKTGQVSGDTQTGDICFQLALIGVGILIIDQAFIVTCLIRYTVNMSK